VLLYRYVDFVLGVVFILVIYQNFSNVIMTQHGGHDDSECKGYNL